ncbi:MAG: hypothetical protein OHK0046_46070 [Anaerolineae bacterium]
MARVVETVLAARTNTASFDQAIKKAAEFDASVRQIGSASVSVRSELIKLRDTQIVDPRKLEQAIAKTGELEAQMIATRAQIERVQSEMAGLTGDELTAHQTKLARLERQYVDLGARLEDVPRGLQTGLERAAQQQEELIERQRRLIDDQLSYDRARSETEQRIGRLGDFDTSLREFGNFAGLVGGQRAQGLATGVVAAADTFAVAEQIGFFTTNVKQLGQAASQSGGLVGSLARGAQTLVPTLSGTAAGLLAVGAAALPLVAVGGALAAVYIAVTRETERARKEQERINDVTRQAVALQNDYYDLIATGTSEQIQAEIERLEGEQEALSLRQQVYEGQTQALTRAFAESNNALGQTVGTLGLLNQALLNPEAKQAYEDYANGLITQAELQRRVTAAAEANTVSTQEYERVLQELRATYGEELSPEIIQQALAETNQAFEENARRLEQYRQALDEDVVAENDRALARQQVLDNSQRRLEEIRGQEEQLAARRAQSEEAIERLAEQEADLAADRQRALTEQAEDRRLRDARELEEYQEELGQRQERIQDIRQQGLEELSQLEAQAAAADQERVTRATQQEQKLLEQSERQIEKIEQQYAQESLKRLADYNEARADAEEDLNNTVFDALLNNDIIAIRRAQRQAEVEERRRDREFGQETQARADQQAERLAELRSEHTLRLTELKAGLAAEREQISQQLIERVAETRTRVAEQISAEREAAAEQDRLRERRLQRQTQDEAIADERAQAAFERQITQITRQREVQLSALDEVTRAVQLLKLEAQSLLAVTQRQEVSSIPSDPSPRPGRGPQVVAFAQGGVVPRGRGVMGFFEPERSYDELVLPLSRSVLDHLGLSMMGATTISVGDITVSGDGVTAEDVRLALREMVGAINAGLNKARIGA